MVEVIYKHAGGDGKLRRSYVRAQKHKADLSKAVATASWKGHLCRWQHPALTRIYKSSLIRTGAKKLRQYKFYLNTRDDMIRPMRFTWVKLAKISRVSFAGRFFVSSMEDSMFRELTFKGCKNWIYRV